MNAALRNARIRSWLAGVALLSLVGTLGVAVLPTGASTTADDNAAVTKKPGSATSYAKTLSIAISSQNGGYQGVGFAIPVNQAKWVSSQLAERGAVRRAYLGVVIQQITSELAERFGVKARNGVLVSEVQADTPGAKSGLKPGDVVVQFAGQTVSNPQQLQAVVEQAPVGSRQPLVVLRDGKRVTLEVTLHEQPKDFGLAKGQSPNGQECR